MQVVECSFASFYVKRINYQIGKLIVRVLISQIFAVWQKKD